MPCYHPLEAWRGRVRGSSGKTRIVFKKEDSSGVRLELPCGQCVGCRLEHSRQWAVRIMHEASLYDDNCFLTLTYSPESLPADGSLQKAHFQNFMKRLRFRFSDIPIRFFHCGEYGERLGRPHYHACIFGFNFPDRVFYKDTAAGPLWTSDILDSLWSFGCCVIGSLSFESAAYVARYCVKKVTGDRALEHYTRVDVLTGEIFVLQPEYVTMSRRPGIARAWWERFSNEVINSDSVVVRGHECSPPRYYDNLLEAVDAEHLAKRKRERLARIKARVGEFTRERLLVKEKCAKARVVNLKRGIES